MSSDEKRVGVDELLAHAEPVPVDQLDTNAWADAPWAGDVGGRAVQSAVFGNLELILTHGDVVLHGADRVEAERFEQRDDGMVPVVDLQALGYSRAKAEAAVLSIRTHYDRDRADPHMLAELVTSLATEAPEAAVGAGWDGDSIDTLMAALDELGPTGLRDDLDDQPGLAPLEPDEGPPVTRPGDVWTLGPHRIMCGDCRNPDHVTELLDGATINLAFTSPPYADRRTYDETSGFKPIPPDEYVDWFEPVQANVADHLAPDGSWFINIKPGSYEGERDLYVADLLAAHKRSWEWRFVDEFCWHRAGLPGHPLKMGRRFKNGWEPVYQFTTSAEHKMRPDAVRVESNSTFSYQDAKADGLTGQSWATRQGDGSGATSPKSHHEGMAFPSNVIMGAAGGADVVGHSAAFPVGLPDFFVRAYTDEGDTVFDPFMGSGSTLLAADQNGRIGFGMEISPKYCDVICARWELVTGVKPERNGEPYSFVEAV